LIVSVTPVTMPTPPSTEAAQAPQGGEGFASQLASAFSGMESGATTAETAFAAGGGSLAETMAQTAQASLLAEEFSLLIAKAMAAYQSVTSMQI